MCVACAVILILALKSATAMDFKSSLDRTQLIFGRLSTTFRTNAWKYKKEQEQTLMRTTIKCNYKLNQLKPYCKCAYFYILLFKKHSWFKKKNASEDQGNSSILIPA